MKIWSVLIGISCLLTTGSVQAGPPFVTDDPEPPPPGGWKSRSRSLSSARRAKQRWTRLCYQV